MNAQTHDLAMKDAIDGMTIFKCGFKFQNATHANSVKQLRMRYGQTI